MMCNSYSNREKEATDRKIRAPQYVFAFIVNTGQRKERFMTKSLCIFYKNDATTRRATLIFQSQISQPLH